MRMNTGEEIVLERKAVLRLSDILIVIIACQDTFILPSIFLIVLISTSRDRGRHLYLDFA